MAGDPAPPSRPWWQRLAWLVVIWTLSVGGVVLAALLLKLVMRVVGLSG